MKFNVLVVLAFISFLTLTQRTNAQTSLAEGTQITMADDTRRTIESVREGDVVLCFNANDMVYTEKKVTKISRILHNRLVLVALDNKAKLTMTIGTPMYAEKGWVSVDAPFTRTYPKYSGAKSCEPGDFLLYYNKTSTDYVDVRVIQGIMDPMEAYTIEVENNGENPIAIVANGFLIGLE